MYGQPFFFFFFFGGGGGGGGGAKPIGNTHEISSQYNWLNIVILVPKNTDYLMSSVVSFKIVI